jgi:hypothetical protein
MTADNTALLWPGLLLAKGTQQEIHSQAAYQRNNHVFVPIGPPTQASPKDTCNVMFGFPANQGCVAVYGPAK